MRGPQDGVYAVVCSPYSYRPARTMVGCAVYGFTDHDTWLGVTAASAAFLAELVHIEQTELSQDHRARHTDWLAATRHNQGDADIAGHLGAATPATPVGQPATPVLLQVLQQQHRTP